MDNLDLPEIVRASLQMAQDEHSEAEICLIEASARAETAREAVSRLEAAVAALNGETPVGPPAQSSDYEQQGKNAERPDHTPERAAMAELSPEEFDEQRKRKQKQRKQDEIDNNPHGTMKCPGCGVIGQMAESVLTTAGGGSVRMLVCGNCRNQQLL